MYRFSFFVFLFVFGFRPALADLSKFEIDRIEKIFSVIEGTYLEYEPLYFKLVNESFTGQQDLISTTVLSQRELVRDRDEIFLVLRYWNNGEVATNFEIPLNQLIKNEEVEASGFKLRLKFDFAKEGSNLSFNIMGTNPDILNSNGEPGLFWLKSEERHGFLMDRSFEVEGEPYKGLGGNIIKVLNSDNEVERSRLGTVLAALNSKFRLTSVGDGGKVSVSDFLLGNYKKKRISSCGLVFKAPPQ